MKNHNWEEPTYIWYSIIANLFGCKNDTPCTTIVQWITNEKSNRIKFLKFHWPSTQWKIISFSRSEVENVLIFQLKRYASIKINRSHFIILFQELYDRLNNNIITYYNELLLFFFEENIFLNSLWMNKNY